MPLQFPLVGKIAAGRPIEKCAQDETLRLEELFGPRRGGQPNAMFALQVDGWSMRDEGIFDGDYVIVRSRRTSRSATAPSACSRPTPISSRSSWPTARCRAWWSA
ncbi:MAG: hypothetical protein EBU31_15995 [Proteobacteria bacterium]|nr:hypothetical protein [Pseudomonadota bacterium]